MLNLSTNEDSIIQERGKQETCRVEAKTLVIYAFAGLTIAC
jgi:hypothetical protein